MMTNPILSIIIPIYNVEHYIERCLHSVINQSVSDDFYEIILVDDGSTDNSYNVALSFCQSKTCSITLLSKENGGLGSARNLGLRHSKGKYIWYIDSDDYINADILHDIIPMLERNEVIILNYVRVFSDGRISKPFRSDIDLANITSGIEVLKQKKNEYGVPFYIIRKDLMIDNNLYFENILHEDCLFTPILLFYAQRVCYINRIAYFYYCREGSITTSNKTLNQCGDLLFIQNRLISFAKSITDFKERYIVNQHAARSIYGTFLCWIKLRGREKYGLFKKDDFKLMLYSIFFSLKLHYLFIPLMYYILNLTSRAIRE